MLKGLTPVHQALFAADDAWQEELVKQFGRNAGDVRYTKAGNGAPGTKLRALYDAYTAARTAWYVELDARRAA